MTKKGALFIIMTQSLERGQGCVIKKWGCATVPLPKKTLFILLFLML